ncbi:MAG: tryptophan--tRNA ligase [Candidatus Desulfofervidus auxilii]|nr:tryptophan--tRNA ligase [Candidatus Desulfofervidus auxilii]
MDKDGDRMDKTNKEKGASKARIDPWTSDEIRDYDRLFEDFGLKRFPDSYRDVIDSHIFKRPGIIVAERDFDKIIDRIKEKKPFIVMTGIASSGPLHLGHKMIIDLVKSFKKMNAKIYFAICDIDAYVSRPDYKVPSLEKAKEFAVENLAHAFALGLEKQDVYVQSQKERRFFEFSFELSKKITANTFKAVYGHLDLGKIAANLLQYADVLHPQLPEYEGKMPSLTPIGLEQDPHARVIRDIAKRLPYNFELPSFLYITPQPGLQEGSKMSSSKPDSSILLSDDINDVKKKLYNAFTGGRVSVKEQRRHGGVPEKCKIYTIFKYHHVSSKSVEEIFYRCKTGSLLCGECKNICFEFIEKFLLSHQDRFNKYKPIAEEIVYEGYKWNR